jgi:transposase
VEVATYQLTETLHQSPETFGLQRSRWWLDGIRQVVPWLGQRSLSGVWKLLSRLDIHYKRGRRYVHSPDPDYRLKEARIHSAWQQVVADPVRFVLLYQDELTYYRCPTVSCDYANVGSKEPEAEQGTGYNSSRRIAGCLDALSGRLITWQRAGFPHKTFLRYLLAVQACYPQAERIFIALDNWSVHYQAEVVAGLKESKITLLFLPTYAPWLNPIEKVWRKLKQELLHLHRYHAQWKDLQQRVEDWLIQYDRPAPDLLHYVGLSPD